MSPSSVERGALSIGTLIAAAAALLLPARAIAALGPSAGGNIQVKLQTMTTWVPTFPAFSPGASTQSGNFELAPTDMVPFNDGTGRFLVSTLGGTIRVIGGAGNLVAQPLLTTTQTSLFLPQEAGMTGIALHPNFAGDPNQFGYGRLYTITTERGTAGTADYGMGTSHQDVIREWNLSSLVGNPAVNSLPSATVASSREVLRVAQPGPFHNLPDLTFNSFAKPGDPDYGQLYISSGDGSPNGDATRFARAQDPSNIFGNILRINPNPTAHALVHNSANTGQAAYSISPNNAFIGTAGVLPEVMGYGLRSPYRLNFDRETGRLYIGEVGENRREWVHVMTAGGDNFGWGRFEGSILRPTNPQPPPSLAGPNPVHTLPLFEYPHNSSTPGNEGLSPVGRTVVGGFVYRGLLIPELYGKYVFADFGNGTNPTNFDFVGKLFYGIVDPADPQVGQFFQLQLDPTGSLFPVGTSGNQTLSPLPYFIFSIAEDAHGELYVLAGQDPRRQPFINDAYVIRLVPEPASWMLLALGALIAFARMGACRAFERRLG